jgi:hypothetical protein
MCESQGTSGFRSERSKRAIGPTPKLGLQTQRPTAADYRCAPSESYPTVLIFFDSPRLLLTGFERLNIVHTGAAFPLDALEKTPDRIEVF